MTTRNPFLIVLAAFCLLTVTARAQVYTADLSGPNENPVNASPGTGFAMVTLDLATHTFTLHVDFTGLLGTTSASHIHAPAVAPANASVATQTPSFANFPLGVTSGNYDNTFDMTLAGTWNSSYITNNGGTPAGAEAAFVSALNNGTAYLNIHTNQFPGGEIRGFLAVPEPATTSLLIMAVAGLGLVIRRGRRA